MKTGTLLAIVSFASLIACGCGGSDPKTPNVTVTVEWGRNAVAKSVKIYTLNESKSEVLSNILNKPNSGSGSININGTVSKNGFVRVEEYNGNDATGTLIGSVDQPQVFGYGVTTKILLDPSEAASIGVDTPTLSFSSGGATSRPIMAYGLSVDNNRVVLAPAALTWSSSNSSVAAVAAVANSSKATVTSDLSVAGTTTITVNDSLTSKSATCIATVTTPYTLEATDDVIWLGESGTYRDVYLKDQSGNYVDFGANCTASTPADGILTNFQVSYPLDGGRNVHYAHVAYVPTIVGTTTLTIRNTALNVGKAVTIQVLASHP